MFGCAGRMRRLNLRRDADCRVSGRGWTLIALRPLICGIANRLRRGEPRLYGLFRAGERWASSANAETAAIPAEK